MDVYPRKHLVNLQLPNFQANRLCVEYISLLSNTAEMPAERVHPKTVPY